MNYSNKLGLSDSALLNGINFFGVDRDRPGAFVPIFLKSFGWRERDIGFVVFLKAAVALFSQMPIADAIDKTNHKKLYALFSEIAVPLSGLILLFHPFYITVIAAMLIQGIA